MYIHTYYVFAFIKQRSERNFPVTDIDLKPANTHSISHSLNITSLNLKSAQHYK